MKNWLKKSLGHVSGVLGNREALELSETVSRGMPTWYILLLAQLALLPLGLLDVVAVQYVTDRVIVGNNVALLPKVMGLFAAILLVLLVLESVTRYFAIRLVQFWDAVIRNRFLRCVLQKPLLFYREFASGEMLYRLLNDSSAFPAYMTQMRWQFVVNSVFIVVMVSVLCFYDLQLTFLVLSVVPIQFVIMRLIARRTRPLYEQLKNRDQELMGYLGEALKSIDSIRAHGYEDKTRNEWVKGYRARMGVERRLLVLEQIFGSQGLRLSSIGTLLVLWVGAVRLTNGTLSMGTFVLFLVVGARLAGPVGFFASYHLQMQDIVMCCRRIKRVWSEGNGFASKGAPVLSRVVSSRRGILASPPRHLTLEDVSFSYGSRGFALTNVSWQLPRGEVVRLDGMNGAGKSTLLKLMAGLIEPLGGSIRVDDVPVHTLLRSNGRHAVLYMPRESFWLRDTLRRNLLHGVKQAEKIGDDELARSMQAVQAEGIVFQLPEGLDTIISNWGGNLSSGEKQRLALARALLLRPAYLLLDEATSSISEEGQSALLQGIRRHLGGNTTIVYVRHGSVSLGEDEVVRIENGRLWGRAGDN
jgi:ATP-binding cassette subfamily B protein